MTVTQYRYLNCHSMSLYLGEGEGHVISGHMTLVGSALSVQGECV